ncbi:MAG TPA: preprotein translocase subunit YajC [Acetivibrio sp.]|mgnify:CR=1 FL=1|jgi:preprotein translocase subunit YajC|nr:preprotein translocase subunit YajC [Acetivibrio sp.]HPT92100.1 preprotein translocase subunit YajC [Acetivibrio sp.]HQA59102.1 preprotein translocase subunit YajC [Acetivibrio sp.]
MPQGYAELIGGLIIPIGFIVIMYLMVILPQKKREKQLKQMLDALQVGDNVITTGGIIGKIVNIKDDEVTIETGVEKTKIKFVRSAIASVEKESKDS